MALPESLVALGLVVDVDASGAVVADADGGEDVQPLQEPDQPAEGGQHDGQAATADRGPLGCCRQDLGLDCNFGRKME